MCALALSPRAKRFTAGLLELVIREPSWPLKILLGSSTTSTFLIKEMDNPWPSWPPPQSFSNGIALIVAWKTLYHYSIQVLIQHGFRGMNMQVLTFQYRCLKFSFWFTNKTFAILRFLPFFQCLCSTVLFVETDFSLQQHTWYIFRKEVDGEC